MQVCLMVEGQEGVAWQDWVALAEACEEHGLDGLFRSDHYAPIIGGPGDGSLDAWATIAALGARTTRLRLGTLVSPVTFRHPSELAKVVTTADHVSGGRVELGLGAGWYEGEHRAYGFPFPEVAERYALLAEQLELVHRQWSDETVDFHGAHYSVEGLRAEFRPVQRPHPPLIVGGHGGPRSLALAARWADEYNAIGIPLATLGEGRVTAERAWEDAGRDPADLRYSTMTACVVGVDEAEVAVRGRRLAAKLGQDGDPMAFLAARADRWLVGTTYQVVERLGELADAGITRVMLQHLVHDDLEMVALLGQAVAPAVR